jgi:hypothetical protein
MDNVPINKGAIVEGALPWDARSLAELLLYF